MSESGPISAEQRLLVMRIIHGALCFGTVSTAVILVAIANPGPPPVPPMLTWFGVAFAVFCLLQSLVVPYFIDSARRRRVAAGQSADDPDSWWTAYQTRLIIALALLEGAAFFQPVAYLLEG